MEEEIGKSEAKVKALEETNKTMSKRVEQVESERE
jgi:hypothetical protein